MQLRISDIFLFGENKPSWYLYAMSELLPIQFIE